jgi:FMN phosphatase YigB (HAD superfamily)
VELLINELLKTQVAVSVLTNGVIAAQKNKWDSLQLGRKESISFYIARELGGDKPSAETFEAWRTLQNVEWSRVIAVGDKYDNDIAYPLEMGASAVLVNTYGHSNKGNDRLSQTTNIPDAIEHILTLVGRV